MKKSENFRFCQCCTPFSLSEQPFAPSAVLIRRTALRRFGDEDNIVSDLLDAVPGDVILLPPAKEAEKPAGSRDDQRCYPSLRDQHLYVAYKPQTAAVTNVDDLFVPQFHHSALHLHPPSYGMVCSGRIVLCEKEKYQIFFRMVRRAFFSSRLTWA